MAKRSMGVRIIEEPANPTERWLMDTLRMQSSRAGIGTPEMGIFDSPEPNAFATGWNKNNALVAVSTGLLERMKKGEVEAVVAHEVSHVANGDMITMALIQGVVNTFVVFLARLVGFLSTGLFLKINADWVLVISLPRSLRRYFCLYWPQPLLCGSRVAANLVLMRVALHSPVART